MKINIPNYAMKES